MEIFLILLSIIFLDICLSGDNVVVIAMAAAGLPRDQQNQAITIGMIGAVVIRIVLALCAIWLMHYMIVQIIGGVLLLWVAKNLLMEILPKKAGATDDDAVVPPSKDLVGAIATIVIADVSMSMDNILAIASIAKDHPFIMALGFILSIAIVGVGSKIVIELLKKWPWINWVGLSLIVFVAIKMLWTGISATV